MLLDLFCGAGGAAMGYYRAGFTEIIGVDIKPQPRYPFEFVQADAMTFPLEGFDAIHASPPCQGYSIMLNLPWNREREYPVLLLPVLERLEAVDIPYVIENVMGARRGARGLGRRGLEEHGLEAGWLCGLMFGLPFYRHRLFATNWFWLAPGHPRHTLNLNPRSERFVYGGTERGLPSGAAGLNVRLRGSHVTENLVKNHMLPDNRHLKNGAATNGCGVGHAAGWKLAAEAMGIDWMKRDELTQAIPPAFTEYIGKRLLECLSTTAA